MNANWVQDTLNELKKAPYVQIFQTDVKQGPNNEALEVRPSFGYIFHTNIYDYPRGYENAALGLGMAMTRWAYEKAPNLYEYAIVGGGDYLLMLSLIQKSEILLNKLTQFNLSQHFVRVIEEKQQIFKKNNISLSYVNGTVLNHWHGRHKDRKYWERWSLLAGYDPKVDLTRNEEGILNLSKQSNLNKAEITHYFLQRHDDNMQT